MIADMVNNIKLNSRVTELFNRGRELNISLAFITQSCFKFRKDARLNTTHFFITKIPDEICCKLQQMIHQTLVLKILLISIENVL